jgi:gentisate 1,2-dioxygenase
LGALVEKTRLRPPTRGNLQQSVSGADRAAARLLLAAAVTQSIETHIEVYAPGAYGQKHGHLNSAVFYVLKGRGHDVHDGKRIEWKAGDIMIVENGCVHQHFNDDPDNEAILLVFKAKPLFLFMHLLFQKIVSYPPTEPPKGHEDFKPPTDL